MNTYYEQICLSRSNFFLIAGPCVVESKEICNQIAETLVSLSKNHDIPVIFKASYRKANRSSMKSFTGIGDQKALEILADIRQKYGVPVITDIHESTEASLAAEHVDFLQIPAFLCRQSDLLIAAGQTGKPVNIKKGQFLAPDQIKFAAEKVKSTGNNSILLTERGSQFGYRDLVVDFRSIPTMQQVGYPVIFDGTHSLQQPNAPGGVSGGKPEFIETLCKSAIAAGANGLFLETHPHPGTALSDGANMLPLDQLEKLLLTCKRIYKAL